MSSHGVEHLPICLHFVDKYCDIREYFIGFVKLKRVRALDIITEAIIHSIESLELSFAIYVAKDIMGHSQLGWCSSKNS